MLRLMRAVRAIGTLRHRAKVKNIIKEMESLNLEMDIKDDDFDYLVNHVIEINSHIQKIVWERGLLRSTDKCKTLRSCLR